MADHPFDGNAYRKEVLKGLLAAADLPDDPFLLVGLPPDADDEEGIRAHIDRVVGFWRKEQSSPRYGALATTLLGRRDALMGQLLDPSARAAARQRLQAQQQQADAHRFDRLDALLDQLQQRFGAIPRSRVARLRELVGDELTDAEISDRLSSRQILEDGAEDQTTLPDPLRRRVRTLLVELARLRGAEDPEAPPLRTLHDFLDVDPGAPTHLIEQRRAAIEQRNRQRRHDRLRTVVDELLALTTQVLVTGDPTAYGRALADDAADVLAPRIETVLLLEDRVSALEFERLLREAVELGLTPDQARAAVVGVAGRMGAPIETGAVIDYVTCTRCGAAQPREPDHRRCARCQEPLYRTCPRCGADHAAAAHTCPSCGLDIAGLARARADLATAVAALDDGRTDDAAAILEVATEWAEHLPELAGVRERLRTTEVQAALAQLPDQPDAAREEAVLQLLRRHPGAAAMVAELRRIGLQPARDVAATATVAGVELRWGPSPSPGAVTYRVTRDVRPVGSPPVRTALGQTGLHTIEDAGAPPGTPVVYLVTAVREGIAAPTAESPPLVLAPEVSDLRALQHDGAIELIWTAPTGASEVWVDVEVVGDADTPRRRIRGGTSGVLDTDVTGGRTHRYSVIAEYRPVTGPTVHSGGRSLEVAAVVLPDPPRLHPRTTVDRVLIDAPASGTARLLVERWAVPPDVGVGRIGQVPRAADGTAVLSPRRGVISDALPGPPRWYLPHAVVGDVAVAGHVIAHPGVGPVTDLAIAPEGADARVTWTWPTGCTEARLLWGPHPPRDADDDRCHVRKCTNSRYQIDGGVVLPDLEPGTHHLLVVPLARAGGDHVALPDPDDGSRAVHVHGPATPSQPQQAGRHAAS